MSPRQYGSRTFRDLSALPHRAVTFLSPLKRELAVLALAAAGGTLFALTGAEAAWLSGSMLAVAAFGLLRPLPVLRKGWFEGTMLLSGALIGSAATPEAVGAAARYPASLAVLFLGLAAIIIANGAYLRFVGRWNWTDAVLASAPGALTAVIAVAHAKGADIGKISVIQLFRILVLVACLPGLMQYSGTGEILAVRPVALVSSLSETLLVLGCGVIGAKLFALMRITAPTILGATIASAILHGTGLVQGNLPALAQNVVLVMLGAVMGGRISTVKRSELLKLFPLALGGFVVSIGVAFAFAWPAALVAGVPYSTAMLAFAPGGLEAMAMLAFTLGLDPLYVGAHHLARFLGLGLAMPFLVGRRRPEQAE